MPNKGRPAGRSANCAKLEEEGRVKLILATFQFPAEPPALATAAFRVNKPAKKQWNWFFEALKIVAHRPASIPWKFHSKSSQRKTTIPVSTVESGYQNREKNSSSLFECFKIDPWNVKTHKSLKVQSRLSNLKCLNLFERRMKPVLFLSENPLLSRYRKDIHIKKFKSYYRKIGERCWKFQSLATS